MFIDNILRKIRNIVIPYGTVIEGDKAFSKVTASAGIVTWDKVEGTPSVKLLELVENALKAAKNDGREKKVQYQFYSKPTTDGKHKIDKKVIKDGGVKNEV